MISHQTGTLNISRSADRVPHIVQRFFYLDIQVTNWVAAQVAAVARTGFVRHLVKSRLLAEIWVLPGAMLAEIRRRTAITARGLECAFLPAPARRLQATGFHVVRSQRRQSRRPGQCAWYD